MKPSPATPSQLSEPVHHQLSMYALAASAAGVGMLALAQPAEAKIVYTKTNVHVFGYPCNSLDLNNDGIADFWFCGVYNGSDCATEVQLGIDPQTAPSLPKNAIWYGGNGAAALRAGTRVGRGAPFPSKWLLMAAVFENGGTCTTHHSTGFSGPWENGGKGVANRYLGLRFEIRGKIHYGWARLSVPAGFHGVSNTTMTGYAYETIHDKPIITGKTKGADLITLPPGSLGHLSQGSARLAASRSGN
jgi:hypothetical protein